MKFPHSSYRMENSRNLMTRVHALFACLILIAAPLSGCLSGDDLEELVDDIIGCMDENAENYDDNATSELVGDCIYMATMDTFMDAMSDVRSIEEMLEDTPKAGYSQSITVNEWNDDLGMQMDIQIDETVMVDLDNDAVHVYNLFSLVPMMTMSYTHTQIGEVVNVHYAVGGMMAGGEAESGSYQTRDATPNVLEVLAGQVGLFWSEDDGLVETPGEADLDEIPEGAVTTITMSDDMESQTMTMEYTEDGAEITMTIHINQNEDLMSFSTESDNGSATTSMTYEMMWGDAIVIEVDETLPKTSIPVWIDIEPWWDDDDGDDLFLCDNGNEIPWDYVDDGWDDCGDGSDESDDDDDDDERSPEEMMDYMDTDEDGHLSLQELFDYVNDEREQDGEPPMSEEDEEGTANWFYSGDTDGDNLLSLDEFTQLLESTGADGDDGNGAPTPEEAMESVDANDDGYMSYQEFQDAWESDPENPELDYDEVTILFDDCDYDDNDLIDIDEMQCFIDGIVDMISDGGDEDPEQMFGHIDTDDDGYVSLQDILDFSNEGGDDSDDEIDEEELSDWFSWCDTDGDDLLNLDEFTTCVEDDDDDDPSADEVFEWMNTDGDGQVTPSEWADFANSTGDIIEEEDFNNLVYMMDMYDYDDSDGLDIYEFAEMWDEIMSDEDDDGDGEGGNDEPSRVTMMVMGQTLNAPISDFEVRFLVDCGEPDEEGNEPPISDCTIAASNGLTEGSATVDPAIAEYEFTYEYLDYDGDGLISDMDTLVIDNLMPGVQVELYDTWADQYTRESFATAEMLPGFGALMALTVLLGAAFATRRD